ncbi:MAG TPA: MarR family transcriptional regulator [Chitinophagaceae bacterium]|nr:MarR family transcriptional regulator [Chitinophagaceae bacterium]
MKTKNVEELAIELGRCMTEMKNYLRQFIQAKIKEDNINLTFEMLEILGCLWNRDGINQQELANITIKDKSSMTYLVDNLVKRNMIKRVPDENDRRNNLIYLTKEGKELQTRLYPWVVEMYAKATADVCCADVEGSLTLMKKMIGNMQCPQK